ncbi:hypothetical protein ACLBWT_12220 [Paenibacillus sp. D51F]
MDYNQYFAIDQALHEARLRREMRFNAYSVAYWAGLSNEVQEVNKYLLQKVGTILTSRIEFICPNNHPTSSIKFGEEIPVYATCHVCGEEFQPSLLESNIAFWFKELPQIEVAKKKVQQLVFN